MNKPRYASMVTITLLLPVLGALIMYILVHFFPMWSGSFAIYTLYSVLIIMLGLVIPYGFLKAFSIAAHEWDPKEKELHLDDIPKDKQQSDNTPPH